MDRIPQLTVAHVGHLTEVILNQGFTNPMQLTFMTISQLEGSRSEWTELQLGIGVATSESTRTESTTSFSTDSGTTRTRHGGNYLLCSQSFYSIQELATAEEHPRPHGQELPPDAAEDDRTPEDPAGIPGGPAGGDDRTHTGSPRRSTTIRISDD